jgi:hypothetical protein
MDKLHRICHDLKTERPDVGRPLPGLLRLVPIALYFCTIAFLAGVAWLAWEMNQARQARAHWQAVETIEKGKQTKLAKEMEEVTLAHKQGEDVKRWVQGSDMMQELIVLINQSMTPDANISELSITRGKDNPRLLTLTLRITAKKAHEQIDATKGKIMSELQYKAFGDKIRADKGGQIDWTVNLMRPDDWKPAAIASSSSPLPPQ